jgi:hypothetical protein
LTSRYYEPASARVIDKWNSKPLTIPRLRSYQNEVATKERTLEIDRIVADLRREAERIGKAITALLGSTTGTKAKRGRKPAAQGTPQKRKRRGRLTPEGRKRLSDAMKKRWAERRRKG